MNLNLILIRHGQSEGNVDHEVYYQKPDHYIKLTEKGIQQAIELGKKLKEEYFEENKNRVIFSPWERAKTTASIISSFIKPLTSYEDSLTHEIALNHSLKEMVETRKEFASPEKDEYSFYWYKEHTAESYADVYKRARIFYQDLIINKYKFKDNDNVFIVSHGVFILMLKAVILNTSVDDILKERWLGNCETWKTSIETIG